jgi:hypothetical protein
MAQRQQISPFRKRVTSGSSCRHQDGLDENAFPSKRNLLIQLAQEFTDSGINSPYA